MSKADILIRDLPDPDSARRFLDQFREKYPSKASVLERNQALFSDVLTLVSYSPLLAATLLQNPEYLSWLERERKLANLRGKSELLESLARFSLTNSQTEPHIIYARFRRRELMRIFLRDIRRLATIAEVTQEISNVADAILENALRLARQDLDNRYGAPFETDAAGKSRPSRFCVVALGKLGSGELNYSSDIDLLFIYSAAGQTSGTGDRGVVTNREYFTKVAEKIVQLVGRQAGEGAAYRVDLRLRPHGRVGPLAVSLDEAVRYYRENARVWERQVLIRSRSAAGDADLFRDFFGEVENVVFSPNETIENALRNVRLSKEQIDTEHSQENGFDVKLGKGGIREIEFIAQAMQLAHGGRDRWLRMPHTLIIISRLAERGLLYEKELTALNDAYEFLRRLEHILQMENGLQTHLVPADLSRRELIARRMGLGNDAALTSALDGHTKKVNEIFRRVFGSVDINGNGHEPVENEALPHAERFVHGRDHSDAAAEVLEISQPLAALLRDGITIPPEIDDGSIGQQIEQLVSTAMSAPSHAKRLAVLRRNGHRIMAAIMTAELLGKIDAVRSKSLQTELADTAIQAAASLATFEAASRFNIDRQSIVAGIMGLGKLGGGTMDYGSDLDIILVYDDSVECDNAAAGAEMYSRWADSFVTSLSGVTRDGSLYRVDLRLRPFGKNGPSVVSRSMILQYVRENAAVWELLAYLKIRGAGGDLEFSKGLEFDIRRAVHERAGDLDSSELARETRRIRLQLEKERGGRRARDIDIKYGEGGMLDVYFAIRFLQLRDNVPESETDRSSASMLRRLREIGSLSESGFDDLFTGYQYLSRLDHELRLIKGRSTRLPTANAKVMATLAERMRIASPEVLIEELTVHRLNIRAVFDELVI